VFAAEVLQSFIQTSVGQPFIERTVRYNALHTDGKLYRRSTKQKYEFSPSHFTLAHSDVYLAKEANVMSKSMAS